MKKNEEKNMTYDDNNVILLPGDPGIASDKASMGSTLKDTDYISFETSEEVTHVCGKSEWLAINFKINISRRSYLLLLG